MTHTERTAVRRAWGRSYWPINSKASSDGNGYVTSTAQGALRDAIHTLYSGAAAADFLPVVYSKTRGKAYTVESIQVDNLFDIVRRRRYSSPTSRVVRP